MNLKFGEMKRGDTNLIETTNKMQLQDVHSCILLVISIKLGDEKSCDDSCARVFPLLRMLNETNQVG